MNETNFDIKVIRPPMERDTDQGKGLLVPCKGHSNTYKIVEGQRQYQDFNADVEINLAALDGITPQVGDQLVFKGSAVPRSRRSEKGMLFSSLYVWCAGKVSVNPGRKGVSAQPTDSVKL